MEKGIIFVFSPHKVYKYICFDGYDYIIFILEFIIFACIFNNLL